MSTGLKDVTKLSISFHYMGNKCSYHPGGVTELGLPAVACTGSLAIGLPYYLVHVGEVDPYC